MKISNSKNIFIRKISTATKVLMSSFLLSLPTPLAKDTFTKTPQITEIIPRHIVPKLNKSLTKGLKIVENINIRGGVTHCYNDSSMLVLQKRLLNTGIKGQYTCPIDTAIKPYIPSTGQFGSIRPAGRTHLGIDIYPRLYGRKPKKPVAVVSATDGIAVSVKKSPQNDPNNLIANNIKIMAPDGKIYSYDHLGRREDYKGAKYTELKEIGSIIHAGDTLGTVGHTGETAVWHLHFSVEDLNIKKEQEHSTLWKDLHKRYSVYATPRGQIDPLDKEKAGTIADFLNLYRIDKGEKVSYYASL